MDASALDERRVFNEMITNDFSMINKVDLQLPLTCDLFVLISPYCPCVDRDLFMC
jgi:hypothetical protein